MKQLITLGLLIYLFTSCSEKKELKKIDKKESKLIKMEASNLTGNELAKNYCVRCHSFVEPELLPKNIWKLDVLPSMGFRMGIYKGAHQPDSLFSSSSRFLIKEANIYPEQPVLAKEDWSKIVDYYVKNAPDTILPPKRNKKIKMGLKHFKYREASYVQRPALTVMVKILPENKGFVYSDGRGKTSTLIFLDTDLKKESQLILNKTPIHYYEKSDTVYLASVGKNLFPTDLSEGELQKLYKDGPDRKLNKSSLIIPNLQRPVFMEYGDLNNDGLDDVVVCEFGNYTGILTWYENMGADQYTKHILRNKPGAIKAVIKDVNKDGLNDIVALMAQADEGIFYYENKGKGVFSEKKLLSFSPLNGSQNMELVDMNNDGFDDIVYVCGDNADKSPILKNYHGVYIYLNDGDFNFKQSYFYQLNGAYKAMVNDYDLDGDLDIAAISFFPDYVSYPEESFIYLENKGGLKFTDYSFPESTNGRWIVMDAADMDGDGDVDLALGSFVYFVAKGDTTGLGKKWFSKGPSMIVLENTTRQNVIK